MKLHLILSLIVLLSGCALQKNQSVVEKAPTERPVPRSTPKEAPVLNIGVAWELLSEDDMTLQFTNLDTRKHLSITLHKGINVFPVSPGHWELTGHEQNGISFKSMNISKKFVMRVKPKALVYGGSVMVGCPTIGNDDFKLLKTMSFFNRYPFNSDNSICELVVGNDLAGVRSSLRYSRKNKKLNLVMGF